MPSSFAHSSTGRSRLRKCDDVLLEAGDVPLLGIGVLGDARGTTMSSMTPWRMSSMVSRTLSSAMNSLRCSNTTLRWSFMTLSYFRMFLRMSKLRASTFACARSMALLIQGWTMASSSFRPSFGQHAVHAVGAEDAHQVVLQRQVELRAARIALAAGAAAQLVVDAAGFVALGAEHVEAARGERLLLEARRSRRGSPSRARRAPRPRGRRARCSMRILALPPSWMSVPRPAMLVAMVIAPGTPACGDDEGFLLVEAGVQHGEMLDAAPPSRAAW